VGFGWGNKGPARAAFGKGRLIGQFSEEARKITSRREATLGITG